MDFCNYVCVCECFKKLFKYNDYRMTKKKRFNVLFIKDVKSLNLNGFFHYQILEL